MKRVTRGFTLIEVMIAVAIVGILTAIALPQYRDYVTRARLGEAFSALSAVQPSAEQYWSNNRTFANFDNLPANTTNFTYALSNSSASTYTVTATGIGKAAGFVFTINQSGTRATTAGAWGTSTSCWIERKGGACIQ
jgi:type IV pilus assembly protein PilE